MSRLRLPLLGAEPGEIPPIDDALRVPFATPSIALVASPTADGVGARDALREALRAAGRASIELEVVVSDGPARVSRTELGHRIDAPLLEIPDALAAIDRSLSPGTCVLATGAAVVAVRRPTVSILVTGGAPPSEWGLEARSVRERFELVVPGVDTVLARELVARV
ncbi:MAG: hypothetical protein K1X94_31650 [Sandaracinaceae bacterium]|nr:hypothetical protein [Sandaracinaceae bacterium]